MWDFSVKSQRFPFPQIFINMGNHITAKNKLKDVTARIERTLYKLKYGERTISVMDESFYDRVKCICTTNDYPFPLIKDCGEILIECDTHQVFCTLTKLADDYGIIIDTKKTTSS